MTDSNDFAKKIARIAVPEMIQHGVPPTPENYAVWYLYATGRNKALTQKIQMMKERNEEFTPDISQKLYETYMGHDASGQDVQRQSFSAQSLMTDMLELINAMTGETTNYNRRLDNYVERLSGKYQDPNLQIMVKELVERTTQMRDSGGELANKLTESKKEVEQLRRNLEKITDEANHDPLTGLANRKAFDVHFREYMHAGQKGQKEFSLLMLDIDYFKRFNDKFGHLVGDEVLKIVARELMNTVKGSDIVARYGGEEFAVLLPGTPLSGALIVAENLRKSIASRDLTRRDTKESYGVVTISVGAAQFHKGKDTIESLIKRADMALYRSKKGGRNRVTQESFSEEE